MFSRSSWLHLRIPFSYFLLPVFLFSLSISPNFNLARIGWVFLIMHFFFSIRQAMGLTVILTRMRRASAA
jgi:hypothetical protein